MAFSAKPGGFSSQTAQLRYLWEALCRPHVVDTEVICQITPRNSTLLRTNMQRILKQSNVTAQMAEQSRSIDVAAQIKVRRSVDAQMKLFEGYIPVNVATVFLVHRDSKAQLDEACDALANCFQLPAKVVRETEIAWRIWLQTLPTSWEKLLGAPFKRQLTYLTNEAAGLMPLTLTNPGDRSGFELIADEGGSPLRIDFINEHRNIAMFGATRSGKSVLASGMMSQFLAAGYPIVCLDYPKPDGTSTFSDYAEFLKPRAAYFDIRKESNNLMEKPDLRHLPADQQQERFEDYRSFLEGALVTMVLPTTQQDVLLEQTVRSLIGRALTNFFKDPEIEQRYDAAFAGGFGSAAWKQMPTLADFLHFCTPEKLNVDSEIGLIRTAMPASSSFPSAPNSIPTGCWMWMATTPTAATIPVLSRLRRLPTTWMSSSPVPVYWRSIPTISSWAWQSLLNSMGQRFAVGRGWMPLDNLNDQLTWFPLLQRC